jgi:hypothetical protein
MDKQVCSNCNSSNFVKTAIFGAYGAALYQLKDDNKIKQFSKGATIYGDLCLDCGNINRFYIDPDMIERFKKHNK